MANECLILTTLTLTKYIQNLLRDGTLSLISIVEKKIFLGSLDDAINAKRQSFFWTPDNNVKSFTDDE